MKLNLLLVVSLLLTFNAQPARSQTKADVVREFGEPVEAYSVTDRIWMTPEFTRDGQVCTMRLYPKRVSATTNYLQDTLDYWELKDVLDRLAPPERRGEKTIYFGMINMGGWRSETLYTFNNVTFRFLKSVSPYIDPIEKKPKKSSQKTTPKPKPAPQSTVSNEQIEDEMIVPRDAEIATIAWSKRPCAR